MCRIVTWFREAVKLYLCRTCTARWLFSNLRPALPSQKIRRSSGLPCAGVRLLRIKALHFTLRRVTKIVVYHVRYCSTRPRGVCLVPRNNIESTQAQPSSEVHGEASHKLFRLQQWSPLLYNACHASVQAARSDKPSYCNMHSRVSLVQVFVYSIVTSHTVGSFIHLFLAFELRSSLVDHAAGGVKR